MGWRTISSQMCPICRESPLSSPDPTAAREKVRHIRAAYEDDRPTAVLPGSDGTITGVSVNEWLDDDGNPKFGAEKQQ